MFNGNLNTLIWALKKNGFANLPMIISEIGWPIDGDTNANIQHAQSLIDEDEKSIQPGNFEWHWGLYTYDGWPKYQINLGATKTEIISYACVNANCTSLGYKTSCDDLDMQGNILYAFNSCYQKNDQDDLALRTLQRPQTKTLRQSLAGLG